MSNKAKKVIEWQGVPLTVIKIIEGGMGLIYICHNASIGYTVLKTFKDEYGSRNLSERFLREAEIWVRLGAYRHIVQAFEVDFLKGKPCVRLEYVPGTKELGNDLASLVCRKELNLDEILSIAIGVCMGELYAVTRMADMDYEFVHGDLKPPNILVAENLSGSPFPYIAKVTDFGLAKSYAYGNREAMSLYEADTHQRTMSSIRSISGLVCGTPPYMSPEQCMGRKLSLKSDIYSIGCIIHEMITREFIFPAKSMEEFMDAHINQAPRPPSSYNKKIGKVLDSIVMKCVSKSPEARPDLVDLIEILCSSGGANQLKLHVNANLLPEAMTKANNVRVITQGIPEIDDNNRRNALRRKILPIWYNLKVLGKDQDADDYLLRKAEQIGATPKQMYCELAESVLYRHLSENRALLAVEWAKRATEIDPRYVPAYLVLGKAYFEAGMISEAELVFRKVIDLVEEILEFYKATGQYEELRRGIIKGHKWTLADIYFELAKIYIRKGDKKGLRFLCNQLLEEIGEDISGSITLKEKVARIFEKVGEFSLAIKYYSTAGDWWDVFRMNAFLKCKGEAFKALRKYILIEVYGDLMKKKGCTLTIPKVETDIEEHNVLGEIVASNTELTERLEERYRRLLNERSGQSVVGYLVFGWHFERVKRWDDARGLYQDALASFADKGFVQNYLREREIVREQWQNELDDWDEDIFEFLSLYITARLGEIVQRDNPIQIIFHIIDGPNRGHVFVIRTTDEVIIGRQATGALVLDGDSQVSRQHAKIVFADSGGDKLPFIIDMGSTNGTFVNNRLISEAIALNKGDIIRIGKSQLFLKEFGPIVQ